MTTVARTDISKANEEFWTELCGTVLAKNLNIVDHSLESLQKFDDYYLNFYPYLLQHLTLAEVKDKKILEIGLGYGTLGQKLAENCREYIGLDIAAGPVKMMNHRLKMQSLPGKAIQGNMLECSLETASVDGVVSIGCFHHTGDVQRCIDETYRVLKKGGFAYLMLYNRYSGRQWRRWPNQTFKHWLQEYLGIGSAINEVSEQQRAAYDPNQEGAAAPETTFHSIKEIKRMMHKFSNVKCYRENFDNVIYKGKIKIPREKLLSNLAKVAGLDIYIRATK